MAALNAGVSPGGPTEIAMIHPWPTMQSYIDNGDAGMPLALTYASRHTCQAARAAAGGYGPDSVTDVGPVGKSETSSPCVRRHATNSLRPGGPIDPTG